MEFYIKKDRFREQFKKEDDKSHSIESKKVSVGI